MEKATVASEIVRYADGSLNMLNFIVSDEGSLIRREADMNAVVCQLLEAPQEDGTMGYRRIVSIVCKDAGMLDALQEYAQHILRG
jgi:hypothetical protein